MLFQRRLASQASPATLLRGLLGTVCLLFVGVCVAEAQVQLQWSDNSNNENGFYVERAEGENGSFAIVATTGPNVETFEDTNVEPGKLYLYRVSAYNAHGQSGYTNVVPISPSASGIAKESFQSWAIRIFASNVHRSAANRYSPLETLNQHGITNIECYTYGLDPFEPDLSLLPRVVADPLKGHPVVQFNQSRSATGIVPRIHFSNDLETWWLPSSIQIEDGESTPTHTVRRSQIPKPAICTYYRLELRLVAEAAQ